MKKVLIMPALAAIIALLVVGCGGGGGGSVRSDVSISLTPTNLSLFRNGTSSAFIATVTGTNNTRVTWGASKGMITADGVYTAPSTAGTDMVTATSVADPTKSSSVQVIVKPGVNDITTSLQPTTLTVPINGTFSGFIATVTGTSDTRVTWRASKGTITEDGIYTAPSVGGIDTVRITSVADPTKSSIVNVTVQSVISNTAISLEPSEVHLSPNQYFNGFVATVTGIGDTRVTWRASRGAITSQGAYTAPSTNGTYTVTATSVADPSKSAGAVIVVESVDPPPPPPVPANKKK